MDDGPVIVTVFPDNGVKYLSKIFNDSWLESKGLEAAAEGNGAVSEDVETKPIVTKVTWKAGVTPPTRSPIILLRRRPSARRRRTPPRQQQAAADVAALDETHLTLETDSAPPTPAATSAATSAAASAAASAELLAELESHRVAAGEMAAAMAARDDTIAALERELRAALDREVESRSKPPPSEPSLAGEEAADRVAARLAKAETALGKERAAAEEARASLARERETSAAETQRLRDSETQLRARAESAETQLAAAATQLAAAAAADTAMASERAAKDGKPRRMGRRRVHKKPTTSKLASPPPRRCARSSWRTTRTS